MGAEGPAMANQSGWVAGDVICTLNDPGRGRWLTVRGSAYRRPVLHPSRETAVADPRRGQCVAHVTEVAYPGLLGGAFKVTEGTLTSRDGSPATDSDGRPVYA
jgi:hypothetical protein